MGLRGHSSSAQSDETSQRAMSNAAGVSGEPLRLSTAGISSTPIGRTASGREGEAGPLNVNDASHAFETTKETAGDQYFNMGTCAV